MQILLLSYALTALTLSGRTLAAASGQASFTGYRNCGGGACGTKTNTAGFHTAALNQLQFGAGPNQGAGPACGKCFQLTGQSDYYSPGYKGPFHTIKVKVNNLCPPGEPNWCGQTRQNPKNLAGVAWHFDLCIDDPGAAAFFPPGHGALVGNFQEVPC